MWEIKPGDGRVEETVSIASSGVQNLRALEVRVMPTVHPDDLSLSFLKSGKQGLGQGTVKAATVVEALRALDRAFTGLGNAVNDIAAL
jgi:hypothetical protein